MIALPYIVITFFIYSFHKEHSSLHGKCVICYIFSVAIFHTFLGMIQLNERKLMNLYPTICTTAGYIIYTSIFVCFCWLILMCYDVWRCFHDSLFRPNHQKGNERRIFFQYCLFAYGLPITVSVILSIIDATPLLQESLRISMGDGRCWIKKHPLVQLYYLYVPIGLVLTLAAVMYATTARKIYQFERKTSRGGRIQENIDECRVRYFLYFRLFIVWLITWSLEIFLWANGSTIFYNMSEMVNCLHILIIITLFKWKPKVDQLHSVANR